MCVWLYVVELLRLDIPSRMSGRNSNLETAMVYSFDKLDRRSTGMGGAHTIEVESLIGMTWSVGVAEDDIVLKVNHIGWFRLRTKFASISALLGDGYSGAKQYSTAYGTY